MQNLITFNKKAQLFELNDDFIGEFTIGIQPGFIHLLYFGELQGAKKIRLWDGRIFIINAYGKEKSEVYRIVAPV